MARSKESLEKAIVEIQALRKEFWKDVEVVGKANEFNVELEKALRLADFLELGELMARDALNREESCGGHFRVEHQTEEARPNATTSTSYMPPCGSTRARTKRRSSRRSR